ncbi:MAG TPA: hypothetical protein VGW74_19895 [Propionibacteriaceae bacterium]|nr:hypothetical protein [Propionibacteriaceae bacterium]
MNRFGNSPVAGDASHLGDGRGFGCRQSGWGAQEADVGFVVAMVIVVTALAAVSEIVLPLTFAAVLAIVFKPLVGSLERHRLRTALARA